MFPTVNQDMLKTAYDALVIATTNAQGAGLVSEQHKTRLETAVLLATANGQIQGSNDGARKAAALAMFTGDYEAQNKLEEEIKQAQFALELCKIKLNFIRDSIRLDELAIQSVEITAKPVNVAANGFHGDKDLHDLVKREPKPPTCP